MVKPVRLEHGLTHVSLSSMGIRSMLRNPIHIQNENYNWYNTCAFPPLIRRKSGPLTLTQYGCPAGRYPLKMLGLSRYGDKLRRLLIEQSDSLPLLSPDSSDSREASRRRPGRYKPRSRDCSGVRNRGTGDAYRLASCRRTISSCKGEERGSCF